MRCAPFWPTVLGPPFVARLPGPCSKRHAGGPFLIARNVVLDDVTAVRNVIVQRSDPHERISRILLTTGTGAFAIGSRTPLTRENPMLTNKDVAKRLKETAALIELTGGNSFRARALSNAGRTLERLDESVSDLAAAGNLEDLHGIGSGLAAQIHTILETGTFDLREDLISAVPAGLTDMLRVKGLGAKKVRTIWQALGITTIEELEEAAAIGRLSDLSGFGSKTQENILENIQLIKKYDARRRIDAAWTAAIRLLENVRQVEGVGRAEMAGDLRRHQETVDRVVLVAAADDAAAVSGELAALLDVEAADLPIAGHLPDGLPAEIHVIPPERFGLEWWLHTGSQTHVERLRATYGLPELAHTETDVFEHAGLTAVPPPLREGDGEIEAAKNGDLPDVVSLDDLHGTIHNHSRYSDGAHSLEEMAEAARSMGLSYYGSCDHSRSLAIAGGLSIERVRQQQEEIRSLNADFGGEFRIFSGTESDILADGSLDYPDEILASFDLVVASVHTRFNMNVDEATERLIRAVENPYTTILGHPTGRLLLRREGYPINHEQLIDACAASGVAIELNANPHRLDIDWRWIRYATQRGVLISINPDAHSIDDLRYTKWGVKVAQKGWLTPAQCLNAKTLSDFSSWLEAKRSQHGITQV